MQTTRSLEREAPSGVVEQGDNRPRRVREFAKRRNYWLATQDASVAERYLNSNLNLVVRVGRAPRFNVALFRRLLPHERVDFWAQSELVDGESVGRRMGFEQSPMFTSVVHVMEGEKKHRVVPSVVRLETFDRYLISSGKPLYLFTAAAFSLEVGNAPGDRKIDVFCSEVAVSLGELVGEHVETAAQAVDDKTSLNVDASRDGLNLVNLPNLIAGIRVFVGTDAVWVTVDPCGNPLLKNVELGYGPINALARV